MCFLMFVRNMGMTLECDHFHSERVGKRLNNTIGKKHNSLGHTILFTHSRIHLQMMTVVNIFFTQSLFKHFMFYVLTLNIIFIQCKF